MAADSTQFLIDIATRLTGADAATSSLADLGDRMTAAGASAAQLDQAVTAARASVEASSAASSAAAAAVDAQRAKYNEAEQAAANAAKALERVNATLEKQGASASAGKLEALTQRQAEAAARATETAAALTAEGAALDALQASASAAAAEHKDLAAGLDNLEGAAKGAAKAEEAVAAKAAGSGKVNEMSEALGRFGGPLGAIGQKATGVVAGFEKLTGSMGAVAGAAVAATVILAALVAALVAGAVAAVSWAVGLADAARSQELLSQGMAGSVEGGAALEGTMRRLSKTVPLARSELDRMAADLAKSGKSGDALTSALEEAAVAAARAKWGPAYARQLLSLDNQAAKLKRNLQDTFGKALNIEPGLVALDKFGDLLDADSAMGKTLSFAFGKLFQPMLDAAVRALPSIEAMLLGIAIGGLRVYVALKPVVALMDSLSPAAANDTRSAMQRFGETLGEVVAVAAVVAYALLWPFIQIGKGIMDVITASQLLGAAISGAIGSVVAYLSSVSLSQIGTDLIQGLANGITAGASAVISAITGAVTGAIDTAKSLLGIASPSKVFAEIGGYTAEGFTGGVEDGTGEAQGAMTDLVAPPVAVGAAGGSGTVLNLSITINGRGEDDDGLVRKIADAVTSILEGDARSLGGAYA
jgi:hypothetical protein